MFEYKTRVRKATQSKGDCARRLEFMLNVGPHWHDAVHGFSDQGDFPIPLQQRVRAGETEPGWKRRRTGALRQRVREQSTKLKHSWKKP